LSIAFHERRERPIEHVMDTHRLRSSLWFAWRERQDFLFFIRTESVGNARGQVIAFVVPIIRVTLAPNVDTIDDEQQSRGRSRDELSRGSAVVEMKSCSCWKSGDYKTNAPL